MVHLKLKQCSFAFAAAFFLLQSVVSAIPFSNDLFYNAMRAFYFQRCGIEPKGCHLQDAVVFGSGKRINSIGGWHDAGDYGKKIVPGAVATALLLKTYELFPLKFENYSLNIPKGPLPDMLEEIKYELDWMLTMQDKNGGAFHLITTKKFSPLGTQPEKDTGKRYILPVSSAATGDFAATMAMASRIYANYDPFFSEKTLVAAKKAWGYLEKNKDVAPKGGYSDPKGFNHTGAYEDEDDSDERFWAATELLKTTGESNYKAYIEKEFSKFIKADCCLFSWKDVHSFALFEYMTISEPISNKNIKARIKTHLITCANDILKIVGQNEYKAALTPNDYYWGSNGVALSRAMFLILANEIAPNREYLEAGFDQLYYILGRNALGKSYVTGMGLNPPRHPLHYSSFNPSGNPPIPGFLVGGPNCRGGDLYIDSMIKNQKPRPEKRYLDDYHSFTTNEISIYWNALLVFVSGYFIGQLEEANRRPPFPIRVIRYP